MKAQAQRMIGALVLSLATVAVVVGAAQAENPNDRAGALGVGGVAASQKTSAPDWFERAATRALADDIVLPNDRPGKLGVGAVESASQPVVPDWFERTVMRGTPVPTVTTASGDGFQWDDAAFGAAAALGIVLLGMLAALTIRHRNRVILP